MDTKWTSHGSAAQKALIIIINTSSQLYLDPLHEFCFSNPIHSVIPQDHDLGARIFSNNYIFNFLDFCWIYENIRFDMDIDINIYPILRV